MHTVRSPKYQKIRLALYERNPTGLRAWGGSAMTITEGGRLYADELEGAELSVDALWRFDDDNITCFEFGIGAVRPRYLLLWLDDRPAVRMHLEDPIGCVEVSWLTGYPVGDLLPDRLRVRIPVAFLKLLVGNLAYRTQPVGDDPGRLFRV